MESKRQLKIGRLLQRDLSDIFQHDLSHLAAGSLLTVTRVSLTPDLSVAKVYLSVFGAKEKDTVISGIRQNSSEIRGLLGNKIRHQLRSVPELQFFLDDSLDYIERIDDLLKGD